MARRVVTREAGPGFFGWLFLLIFLAINAFMVVFLVIYWNPLAGMPPTATGTHPRDGRDPVHLGIGRGYHWPTGAADA